MANRYLSGAEKKRRRELGLSRQYVHRQKIDEQNMDKLGIESAMAEEDRLRFFGKLQILSDPWKSARDDASYDAPVILSDLLPEKERERNNRKSRAFRAREARRIARQAK